MSQQITVMRFVFLLLFLCSCLLPDAALAQAPQVRIKRTYYDYRGQQLHEEYQYARTANRLEAKNGYYKEYNENGLIKTRATYRNDELNGTRTTYENWGNGPEPFEIDNYKNGVRHGYHALWWFNDTGKRLKDEEGSYYNGKPDGRWTKYETDGTKLVENWQRGVRRGETMGYDAAGNITREGYFDDDSNLFSGTLEEKFDNGELSSTASYNNGLRSGPSQTFYPTGKLKTRRMYAAGRQVGKTIRYLENGEPDAASIVLLAEAVAEEKQARADSIQQIQKDIEQTRRDVAVKRQQDSVRRAEQRAAAAIKADQTLTELAEQMFKKAREKQRTMVYSRKQQPKLYVDLYDRLLTQYQVATNGAERLAKAQRLLALMNLTEAFHRGEQADLNKAIRKEDDLDKVLALTGI